MTETIVEKLLRLAQESIERDRRAFQDEVALERAKLAERWLEVETAWKRVNPPTLEPKPEPQPVVSGPEPVPPEIPTGTIRLDDSGYNAISLSEIIEHFLRSK